ncbi:response regulator transcription factor [Bacillus vallismortis]|uniref:response regulator transcription factor n=1 Tax=Bacillus vallismortis TaxID=72361 RepID=UPI000EF49804|nr:response regulator transcription factor [Bacillus vallismortis]MCY7917424.1 response regulator transcription factor [Bacillus vallismortis]MCY8423311.1 response regulator transcription factor [Bacillus vallismortis]MCY8535008.1 response regulator transcription factor [Bacillus vallismortis]MEC1790175.1 response regulator transcription factor [Bacillus vallismortis]
MKGYHILIVEDDVMIGGLLQKILQREGYHVMWKTDGAEVLSVIQKVDLVIMDVMLPGEDGYQMSAKIKKLGLRIPVIFLSARNDMDSKLQGLKIGEDYMVKPFDPRELLLRMQNMLEHHYGTFTQIKHLYINAETKKVFNESLHEEVLFTAIERKIFFYLYENRDSTLTKEHFFEYLWQLEDRNPNIVNVHIKKIRAKINDQAGEIIENIYGEGYRLNTIVRK